MEQRHLSQEEIPSSIEAWDTFPGQQSLTVEEELTANAPAEQTASADAASLTALLQQEAQNRRREEWTTFAWAGAFLASMLWLASRPFVDVPSFFTNWMLCFGLIGSIGVGLCLQFCRRSYRRKRSLTLALSQSHSNKHVGALIQALRVQNTPVRNLAKRALIDLLPTLQASDAPLLGDAERKILVRVLSISPNDTGYRDLTELFSRRAYRREVDLRVSILNALEQVGGAKELAIVARLARGLPTLQSSWKISREIREAATACLPFLQERAHEQRAGALLLRASNAPSTPREELLRPAATRAGTQPEQLLRASEPDS